MSLRLINLVGGNKENSLKYHLLALFFSVGGSQILFFWLQFWGITNVTAAEFPSLPALSSPIFLLLVVYIQGIIAHTSKYSSPLSQSSIVAVVQLKQAVCVLYPTKIIWEENVKFFFLWKQNKGYIISHCCERAPAKPRFLLLVAGIGVYVFPAPAADQALAVIWQVPARAESEAI